MKKLIAVLLLAVMAFSLFGCLSREDRLRGAPVVKVILQPSYDETAEKEYYLVDSKGHTEKASAFAEDPNMSAYYADVLRDFRCDITDGNIVNTYTGTAEFEDETVPQIMQVAADTIDHNMMALSVWCSEGQYFAFTKLNVNWQDPCILYAYDTEAKELKELYTWQSMELVGISTDIE